MRKAKSIFGSEPEGEAFQSIGSHLPDEWRVYPNLPLSQLVRVGKHELSVSEWDLYLKTSIDFTLCDADNNPSLLIEFDGMGGGFSSSNKYVQIRDTRDPNRALKLDFKLRLCDSVALTLIIVSFEELRPCTSDGVLLIINGIAAQHIARKAYVKAIEEWDSEDRGKGKTWDEMMWDLANLDAETQVEFDPFLKRISTKWELLAASGVEVSLEPLFHPVALTSMREDLPFESVGCRFSAKGGALQEPIAAVVWVRNWAGDELSGILSPDLPIKSGVNPLRVAQNIAECIGRERVLEVLEELAIASKRG